MSAFPSRHKDNSEEATGLLFMRVYNAWHREIKRRLRELDITHPQFVVLAIIGYLAQCNTEISQTMIAAHADMDVMSASQILNLMEKSGLIRRTTHSRDSRAKAIALTDLGTAKMQVALPLVECADSLFFGSLGEREPEFKALLHALRAFRFPGKDAALI